MDAVRDAANATLNDPDAVFELIDKGKTFITEPTDPVDASFNMTRALFAGSLHAVWWSGDPTKNAPPVIVTGEDVPGGDSCDSAKPEDFDMKASEREGSRPHVQRRGARRSSDLCGRETLLAVSARSME